MAKVVIRKQKEDKANSIKVTWDFATERGLLRLSSILIEIIRSLDGGNRLEEDVGDSRVSIRKISREKNIKEGK